MATAEAKYRLDVVVTFTINEAECRALDALAGYGDDAFIKAFYANLGEAYMQKHEAGLRRFLRTIRDVVGPALHGLGEARKAVS